MKAVVVEKHDGFIVALRDDGCFVRVKGKDYEIGDKITLKSAKNGMLRKVVAAAAAFAVMVTAGGVGTNVYFAKEVYSVVSMDINPSIEYSLNRFDKVIAVRGVNTEGEQIAGEISASVIKGDISNALHATFDCLCEKAYITEDEANYMVIGVYSKSAKKQESIGVAVAEFSEEETKLCTVTAVNVTKEEKEAADSLGITAGKMILAADAAATMGVDTTDTDIADLAALSVEELTNIASGAEVPGKDVESAVQDPDKKDPVVSQVVTSNTLPDAVSGDAVADVVSDDDAEIASSSDKSSDVDVSDDKSNTDTTVVSKDKTDDESQTSEDKTDKDQDADQSSSKKDDDKTAVSTNTVTDEKTDDEDADAVSGSKRGNGEAETGKDGTAESSDQQSGDDESISVSKPKSSQYTGYFESGNNITISDTEKTSDEDPTV